VRQTTVLQQSEYEVQRDVFEWAEVHSLAFPELKLLNASLSGVKLPIGLAMKCKRSGMKKGYPDIYLPVARKGYHGLFIEVKVGYNKPSPEQLEWKRLLDEQGYRSLVLNGYHAVIEELRDYLS